ncbi:class I SAM-dependent methyltransferase [Pontibacillus sp. HMF3514]|uniref:class I SAM-dependent DNA methyltransferase n=1 Tax=Pontibacillus sp. HMF3514 TaxID=2692425 RepID=UPI001F36CBA8|nr:class I SAM-dependent methyltransferase [Pontibacillus sp. HMF3514]
MMSYGRFAEVYDTLMKDVPYEQWVQFTNRRIKTYCSNAGSILDLGAGTGEITIQLSAQGYHVSGVDLSEEMLSIAERKSNLHNQSIQWLKQDITNLEVPGMYDIIVSYCDVLNYITDDQDVQKVFQSVYDSLEPAGLFMFDVHSIGYVEHVLKNQTFGVVYDEVSYIWFCDEGETPHTVHHDLTFFVKNDQNYERFDEYHTQRTYSVEDYSQWLKEIGFTIQGIHADFADEAGYDELENDRIFFVCQKPN